MHTRKKNAQALVVASCLLSRNIKLRVYRTVILSVVFYLKLGLSI